MCGSNNICFICLRQCVHDKISVETVVHNDAQNITEVKYVFPELAILLASEIPPYICCSCRTTLHSFYMFKKRCLENYDHLIRNANILQGISAAQGEKVCEIETIISNSEPVIKQEQDVDMELDIAEENEDSLLLSEEQEAQKTVVYEVTESGDSVNQRGYRRVEADSDNEQEAEVPLNTTCNSDMEIKNENTERPNFTSVVIPCEASSSFLLESTAPYIEQYVCSKTLQTESNNTVDKALLTLSVKTSPINFISKDADEPNLTSSDNTSVIMTSYDSSDSESEDILENTPHNIKQTAEAATLDLLPVKSRQKYEQQYTHFIEWTIRNKTNKISENTLLAYFAEKNRVLKPSTLWSHYSMLRSTLAIKNNIQINQYPKLNAFLKQKSVGFKSMKSKTWSKSELNLFLLEAPNDKFLMMKVALIIGVAGACRCDELCKMCIQHVQDKGSMIIVTIPDSSTKRQRVFTITDGSTKNLHLYRTYVSLRPPEITHHRLFLTYRSNKCTVQPVGINTFSKIPSLVAKYLNLSDPNLYTGHCFRRTSATILVAQGGDILT